MCYISTKTVILVHANCGLYLTVTCACRACDHLIPVLAYVPGIDLFTWTSVPRRWSEQLWRNTVGIYQWLLLTVTISRLMVVSSHGNNIKKSVMAGIVKPDFPRYDIDSGLYLVWCRQEAIFFTCDCGNMSYASVEMSALVFTILLLNWSSI